MAIFLFRMRAYAAAHFDWDDVMNIGWPDAVGRMQSEYTGGDDGRAYPVTIHGEIRGEGDSLDEAEPRLANAIGNTLSVIALASNAAIADPLPIAAHGVDLTTPQPFIGYQTPGPDEWFPPGNRRIDLDATLALMTAVGTHPQTDLLHRAIELYRRALAHWIPEQLLLAGEFLFVAAETLSRFLIESKAAERRITPKNLVRLVGADTEKALRWQYLRDDIFGGDQEALDAMAAASNGFEHGYMSVQEVRGLVEGVLERSVGHVRRALITASAVEESMKTRLLSSQFDDPRGLVPVVRIVKGHLSRQDPTLPPPSMDGSPVEIEWQVEKAAVERGKDGKGASITYTTKVTATTLPDNTQLGVDGFAMRAAHVTRSIEQPDPNDHEQSSSDAEDDEQ